MYIILCDCIYAYVYVYYPVIVYMPIFMYIILCDFAAD
jgi:hypothetical protein